MERQYKFEVVEKLEQDNKIKDLEFKGLKFEEINSTIFDLQKRIERDSEEKKSDYIYVLSDDIIIKSNLRVGDIVLKIDLRGKFGNFFEDYKNALDEKLQSLNINKDENETYNIEYWRRDLYAFDEKDKKEGMKDEEIPTKFMHDSNFISDGKSNF